VPGEIYLLTRRCTQRLHLLTPDDEVVAIIEYLLAEASERFGVSLLGWLVMSNHIHVVIKDNGGNYPEFAAHFNKMTAKVMNARLKRRENFWSNEQLSVVRLVNPEDQLRKLVYTLLNPVAADLVDNAEDWPGSSSLRMNLTGASRVVKRPSYFREEGKMPATATLVVERIPAFAHLAPKAWADKLREAIREEEDAHRARRRDQRRKVLGRKAVLRGKQHDRPTRPEKKRELRPFLACADRDQRARELAATKAFREAHRSALVRLRIGERGVVFPFGTYRVARFGVRCAPSRDAPTAA